VDKDNYQLSIKFLSVKNKLLKKNIQPKTCLQISYKLFYIADSRCDNRLIGVWRKMLSLPHFWYSIDKIKSFQAKNRCFRGFAINFYNFSPNLPYSCQLKSIYGENAVLAHTVRNRL